MPTENINDLQEQILKEIKDFLNLPQSSIFKKKYSFFAKQFLNLTIDDISIFHLPEIMTGRLRIWGNVYASSPEYESPCSWTAAHVTEDIYSIPSNNIYDGDFLNNKGNRAMLSKLFSWLYDDGETKRRIMTDFDIANSKKLRHWFAFDCVEPQIYLELSRRRLHITDSKIEVVEVLNAKRTTLSQYGISIKIKNNKKEEFQILLGYYNSKLTLNLDLLNGLEKNNIIFYKSGLNTILKKSLFQWRLDAKIYETTKLYDL